MNINNYVTNLQFKYFHHFVDMVSKFWFERGKNYILIVEFENLSSATDVDVYMLM